MNLYFASPYPLFFCAIYWIIKWKQKQENHYPTVEVTSFPGWYDVRPVTTLTGRFAAKCSSYKKQQWQFDTMKGERKMENPKFSLFFFYHFYLENPSVASRRWHRKCCFLMHSKIEKRFSFLPSFCKRWFVPALTWRWIRRTTDRPTSGTTSAATAAAAGETVAVRARIRTSVSIDETQRCGSSPVFVLSSTSSARTCCCCCCCCCFWDFPKSSCDAAPALNYCL